MSLFEELKRRKVFKVGVGYLVVAWLIVQVASIGFPAFDAPPWALRVFILVLLLGFPISLLFAWAFDVTPEGVKADRAAQGNKRFLLVTVVLIALAFAWYFKGQPTMREEAPAANTAAAAPAKAAAAAPAKFPARSIAVLPFVNMSTDPENEFFSDGISEEILNSLARIEGMQVVGRTSSFQFKGKNTDLRTIGEALGVGAVLEGSVRREGERARITAQLIRTVDGIHLWSETYDRDVKDSLAVQTDIAEQVAGALDVVLDDAQRARMRQAGVQDVDAFIAYQKGWKLYTDAHGKPGVDLLDGLRAANAQFDRATTLEPDFFEAHFAKVDLYEHSLQRDTLGQAKWRQARDAALHTLELAAANSRDEQQRLLTRAERQMLSDDWRGLRQGIDAALAAPGCWGSNWLPVFASAFGSADALDHLGERAIACDPLNSINRSTRLTVALANGKAQRALDLLAKDPSRRPNSASTQRVIALAMLGRQAEAASELERVDPSVRADTYALARIALGRARGESPATIDEAIQGLHRGQEQKFDQWLVVDAVSAANAGNRAEANRLAATMDARPAGPFLLAVLSTSCYCGAPFDLEATPNFKARLAESGLRWPPPATIPSPPGK
jgi:TolB-like protein